jgi:CelD/BcsL family acetyltransferase involved in cellulose biosynthesis
VRISLATSIAEVEKLRPLWEGALHESSATVFQNFDWNVLALRAFSDQAPRFIAVEKDTSVAILPLVVHNGTLNFAGGPLFDYRDAVCAGDSLALETALETVASFGPPLSVSGVRGRAAAARWSRLSPQTWTGAPFVSTSEVSAQTFANKHARGRRALRRLTELGAQVTKVKGSAEALERIYREKAKEPAGWGINLFRDERCIEFMRAVVEFPSTHCELFLLQAADHSVAALVTFVDQGVRRFYTTWMDPAWSKHSPGIALLFEATRLALEEGLDCDYMTGEQAYKMRFATGSEPLYKVEASVAQLSALKRHTEQPAEVKAA